MRRIACIMALLCALSVVIPLSAAANVAASAVSGPRYLTYGHHPTVTFVSQHVALPEIYRVRSGDTLSRIAGREYGSSALWDDLWWSNRGTVSNPNEISVGQKLRISAWHTGKAWTLRRALDAIPVIRTNKVRVATASVPSDPAQSASPVASTSYTGGGSFEACVIAAESGGNPTAVNPTSGAGGLFQFLPSTWASLGFASSYPGGAQTAPVGVQDAAFAKLYAEAGTSPWAPYDGC